MHWPALIVTLVIAVGLVVLIVRQNRKDQKEWTQELNNDYRRDDDDSDYEP